MDILDRVKTIIGLEIDDTSKDAVLQVLLEQAANEFLQYTNRDEIPEKATNVIVDMAVVKYNLLGTEGLNSQSYSGMSETYEQYSSQLIKALNRYRRLIAL